jgi:hypothetical protein
MLMRESALQMPRLTQTEVLLASRTPLEYWYMDFGDATALGRYLKLARYGGGG